MTTALRRWSGSPSSVRWSWTAAIALLAAFALLVHPDTAAATPSRTPSSAVSAVLGVNHTPAAAAMASASATGDDKALRVAGPPADSGDSACSGVAMGHCSTASLDTAELVPPLAVPRATLADEVYGIPAGRTLPGTAHHAPLGLSVLSRLLI